MDRSDSRECKVALDFFGREAEALIDLLNRNAELGDIRERCRRLRAAICESGRRFSAGAGDGTPGSDAPRNRPRPSDCAQAVQDILTFPYPASNRAPRHQLYGWLAHVRYCVERGLGRNAAYETTVTHL